MNYIVQNLKSNRGEVKSSTIMWVCIAVILVVVIAFIVISAWPDSNTDDPLNDFNSVNQDASQPQNNNNNNSGITAGGGGGGGGAVNGAGGNNNTNNNTNNSKDFIKFTINDQEYQARPETTWREWVSTPHNVGGFYMAATDTWYICDANGAPIIGIDPNEVIMDKTAYHTAGYVPPIIP